ncbi:MAG: MBL fold metallo-hydrolase [Saprospiraceae bacterium]|nr:MBL fold metallo-hydrolase [Saprospiraceae bacterium]
MAIRPTYNDQLPFLIEDWQGNPLDEKGLYQNQGSFTMRGWSDVWKWQTGPKPFKEQKKNDNWRPDVLSMRDPASWPADGIAWLGHATFLIRLDGVTLITDPVLGNVSLMKRLTELPMAISDLQEVDVLLLSHNHRDHCDVPSLKELYSRNADIITYTGLALDPLLKSTGASGPVTPAGWYQSFPEIQGIKIHYLPAKHWARRYLWDTNTMLWGSFMIQSSRHTVYFGADSGYGSHYQEIGRLFPGIDLALLGTGAYEPRWFMGDSHMAPEEAARAARDMGVRWWMPMHFGTFELGDEPISQPLEILQNLAAIDPSSAAVEWVSPKLGQWLDLATGQQIEQ